MKKTPERKLEYLRKRYAENAEEFRRKALERRHADLDKAHAIEAKCAANPKRKARKKETIKAWRERNAEKVAAYGRAYQKANRQAITKRTRERYHENPEKVLKHIRARNEAKRGNGEAEAFDRFEIYDRDGGRCHLCGKHAARNKFHLDHLIPLSRGGAHRRDNVAVAHPFCNGSRGADRLPAQLRLIG